MQKIGMLDAFVRLSETEDATFSHPAGNDDQSRLIKMRVLAENPVNLFLERLDADPETGEVGELRFLTHVEAGLDQIEFYYRGAFALRVKGGTIWLDTADNTAFNVESVSPESFARLWEREERDPRILEIERQARHNQMILQQQMEADRAEFFAMMEAMKKNVTPSAPAATVGTPSVSGDAAGQVPASSPSGDTGAPVGDESGTGGQS
ncbi:hypothetical protein [Rhizobium sp. YS-1r]|uniref:hypothetical protein n=1 Tax=Rhizobium sp. YS-1r TaxID=1532558 RepID=UPI00050F3298|nr:hypothetical protein [Rhizobium sp. YS-1r]KGE02474.1 hypothetical protein JL39_02820 [Rhizobium sp. YS-1r]